jgi:hypothetical protein
MPIQGFTRFRKHQVGVTTSQSSNAGATRRLPYRGAIEYDPKRETPDVDTGSLDPTLAAYLGASEITGSWEGKAAYNDLPYLYALAIKGGVSASGSASGRIWTYQAASLTADAFDYATDQWADDVTTDSIVGGGGVIDSLTFEFDDELGAWDVNADLIYSRASFGDGLTGGLTVDESPNWLYGAHTVIYMDTVAGAIGMTPIADAVHGVEFSLNNNLDVTRFANGSNAGFTLQGFGRGAREIELVLTVAKTTATVAEAQTIDDSLVPTRYFDIVTTSTEMVAGGATPFRNSIRLPAELVSREDDEINNNTVLKLTYRGKYDSTLGYALLAECTNETATL